MPDPTRTDPPAPAMVDEQGIFHCPCGACHGRGPVNGVDVWRCLRCGNAYRVRGVVELRGPRPHNPDANTEIPHA